MIRDSIFITLPSDCCLRKYPENEPNDYTVRLANQISLVGRWEVALLEMSFPYEWYNVENVIGVHIISTMLPIQGDLNLLGNMLCVKRRRPPETGWYYEIDEAKGGSDALFKYDYVEVPSGDYSSPQELGDAFANVVSNALSAKYRISQQEKLFQYRYETGTRAGTYFIAHSSLSVFLVLEYSKLANALGLTYRQVIPTFVPPDDHESSIPFVVPELASLFPPKIQRLMFASNENLYGFSRPDFQPVYFLTGNAGESMLRKPVYVHAGGIDSIYIYSDIVEPQLVGDTIAPLLGIVPLRATRGSRQFFTFTSPIYLPVCKQQFSTIHIRLRTARGKPIPFPESSTNAVCMLHLRRYNPFI